MRELLNTVLPFKFTSLGMLIGFFVVYIGLGVIGFG